MAISLLLADDSPTIAKILSLALQTEDYAIKAVLTAEEALTELKANPPDFFLCDLSLPAKNGYEFARLIKGETKLAKIRVVLLASAFEPVDEVMFQDCGADGLVKKPFDPSELRNKLRQLMSLPPKTDSSRVTGSLSGFMVNSPEPTPANVKAPGGAPPPPPAALPAAGAEESISLGASNPAATASTGEGDIGLGAGGPDDLSALLTGNAGGGDADSILSNLLGGANDANAAPLPAASPADELLSLSLGAGNEPAAETPSSDPSSLLAGLEQPPAAPPSAPAAEPTPDTFDLGAEFSLGDQPPAAPPAAPPASLSFGSDQPPAAPPASPPTLNLSANELLPEQPSNPSKPTSTVQLDMSLLGGEPSTPPASAPGAAEEPLSANAQALAAFFAAEISSQAPAGAPPAKPAAPAADTEETFDASLGSIEWGDTGPAKESLNAWSSQSKGAPAAATAAPAAAPPPFRKSSGAGAAHNAMMFDTGGSNFRFSDDYVTRITKSFTGAQNEEVPQRHTPIFPTRSDDSPPPQASAAAASSPSSGFGGGAWSDADMERVEQIVREEVQMVVREVAEKIAWEVIPELAENIIRRELDKVLKEMEPS